MRKYYWSAQVLRGEPICWPCLLAETKLLLKKRVFKLFAQACNLHFNIQCPLHRNLRPAMLISSLYTAALCMLLLHL